MTPATELALARLVLPGFGCFGADPGQYLSIPVEAEIDTITLANQAAAASALNICAPLLTDAAGRDLPRGRAYRSVTLSSIWRGEAEEMLALANKGELLQTRRETVPTIRLRLRGPTALSRIDIPNRTGAPLPPLRDLIVRGHLAGETVFTHDNGDTARLRALLRKILQRTAFTPAADPADLPAEAARLRAAIAALADEGRLGLTFLETCALLPLDIRPDRLDDFTVSIAAAAIVAHFGKAERAATKPMRFLSAILSTPDRLEQVRARASDVLEKLHGRGQPLVVSRHNMHFSRLVAMRDKILDTIARAVEIFDGLGIPLMLGYGTLLGAVRSGGFLAHDDDVDLIYHDGATSAAEVKENQARLIARMRDMGHRVHCKAPGQNMHLTIDRTTLDLFPTWVEGDRIHAMMQMMLFRDMPARLVLPTSRVELHGRSFPAPADPAGFLLERYGPGWATPDPYYGWPWDIESGTPDTVPPEAAPAPRRKRAPAGKG